MSHAVTQAPLDPAALRRWVAVGTARLREHRRRLDDLNVFPVPDSDTGTNMALTFAAAHDALEALPDDDADVASAGARLARAALLGARGNSGVILSAWLGGLVDGLTSRPAGAATPDDDAHDAGGGTAARALRAAAAAARRAVAEPADGTVLSVAADLATAAEEAVRPDPRVGVVAVLDAAADAGWRALPRTQAEHPALRAAGVPDAGAWGLLIVVDALAEAVGSTTAAARTAAGASGGARTTAAGRPAAAGDGPTERPPDHVPGVPCPGESAEEFEVMFVAAAIRDGGAGRDGGDVAGPGHAAPDDGRARDLSAALAEVGDSVAVVGAGGLWHAHVHTADPRAAVDVASRLGLRRSQVRVRHLGVHTTGAPGVPALGLVAVTAAPGLLTELARAGVVVVLTDAGETAGPEVLRAAEDTGADDVLVLAAAPLDPTVHALLTPVTGGDLEVRGSDDDQRGRARPGVLAGLTEVQVVTGAAVSATLGPQTPAAVRRAEVVAAVRAVRCATGGDGDVDALLAGMSEGGATLVTVVTAARTPSATVERVLAAATAAGAEVVVLDGGGPGTGLTVGVE